MSAALAWRLIEDFSFFGLDKPLPPARAEKQEGAARQVAPARPGQPHEHTEENRTMTTIDFARPVASADGRTLSSTTTVVTRPDGTRIELDISTSHWKGHGYRASATRQHADGISRRMALTFGEDSDNRPLPAIEGAPA